jgi:hypothetical protein
MLLLVVIGHSVSQLGTARRDDALIRDVKLIGTVVPSNSLVTICNSMWNEWTVHGYFARYLRISLDRSTQLHDFAVMNDGDCDSVDMKGYERVNLDTRLVHLYRRR